MAIVPTYPGVYVQEIPSGVRTISGVSTSTTLFIGSATSGPTEQPVLCLGLGDFERTFSVDPAQSELYRSVRLFFENGGAQCYVIRIANGAQSAKVTLRDETGINDVLEVTAKEAGTSGNMIRMGVAYRGPSPESSFDLEVFQWVSNAQGGLSKDRQELHTNLSMDPGSPRYAINVVNTASKLVMLTDVQEGMQTPSLPPVPGSSGSGRPVRDDASWATAWAAILGDSASTNKFRISVDGQPFVEVDLQGIDVSAEADSGALAIAIANEINGLPLPGGSTVTGAMVPGPSYDPTGAAPIVTKQLVLSSANGDVIIEPASTNDLAVPLMLGTAQGGIEGSRYAVRRPTPTGMFFKMSSLVTFAGTEQSSITQVQVGNTTLDGTNGLNLQTADTAIYGPAPRMFRDGYPASLSENSDGVREKWNIIASVLNTQASLNPGIGWRAEVWGSRLAFLATAGGDNTQGSISSSDGAGGGTDFAPEFVANVRYYSLGVAGVGPYQVSAVSGTPGGVPILSDYAGAFTLASKEIDQFSLLVLPRDTRQADQTPQDVLSAASSFCQQQRAFLLIDPPDTWTDVQEATNPTTGVNKLRTGLVKDHSAVFFPKLTIRDQGSDVQVGPSGAIAGLMARVDSNRGVWKAPAGTEATFRGVVGLGQRFSDSENGVLNPRGINALRVFPSGIVNWGARTLDGDDYFGSEYKYIPIRRLALYIEESLYRGLQWVVFEPNDEPLWSQVRLNVGTFMQDLFRQGAFQGKTPQEAYFVRCDAETTPQSDRDRGIVNVVVGFAPLKPAEFVILSLQQIAGQLAP